MRYRVYWYTCETEYGYADYGYCDFATLAEALKYAAKRLESFEGTKWLDVVTETLTVCDLGDKGRHIL
jgi:hypothetical protein